MNLIDPYGLVIPPPVIGGIVGGVIGGVTAFLGGQNVLGGIATGAVTGAAATFGIGWGAVGGFGTSIAGQYLGGSNLNIGSALASAAFAGTGTGLGKLFNWLAGGGALGNAFSAGIGANIGIWLQAPAAWGAEPDPC